jgi:hypothetical protein
MVEAAREEARRIIDEDPELEQYPLLQKRVSTLVSLHME